MSVPDAPRLGIGIIGAGRVGAVIGAAWRAAGHAIIGVSATSATSLERAEEMLPGVPVLPPDRIADHVRARWPRRVFPYCTRSSRTADLDHCKPYEQQGPPGQTSTRNLFPLCRRHHRMKTHREMTTGNRWTYRPTDPARGEPPHAVIWTSPMGLRYLVDRDGTPPWPPPGAADAPEDPGAQD